MKRVFILFLLSLLSTAHSRAIKSDKKMKYRTFFGSCPVKNTGKLAIKLAKSFEQNKSLMKLKKEHLSPEVADENFLSSYQVKYNPFENKLNFYFDCPKPLLKVQIFDKNKDLRDQKILVDNSRLFDPDYEKLLKGDKKLKKNLPLLALYQEPNENLNKKIAQLMSEFDGKFRNKISEMIVGESSEMTIILSVIGQPSSVFLGTENWNEKVNKLVKLVEYMEKKRKIPAIVNLTNAKKVVVKFSE